MAENGSSGVPHVDEGTMHAWLDGALPADESRAVELHVASCETCAAAVAEARGLIAASTRILSALDDVPGGVVPASARPVPAAFDSQVSASRRARPARSMRAYVSIAAAAVVVVALGLVVREKSAPVTRAAPSVAARAIDADIGGGVAPQPETSMASASAAPKRASHVEAQKPRVPQPAAPKSQVAVAPKSHAESLRAAAGVAAAGKAAPSPDSLTVTGRVTAVATGLPSQPTALAEVVTGVAAGVLQRTGGFAKPLPSIAGARVISSSVYDAGASRVRHTTFQLDSGATVTLEERRPIDAAPAAEDRTDTPAHADAGARAAPLALRSQSGLATLSATRAITWTSADGTSFTLSGPLSVKELEQLKNRIVP